jgi:hypothetical protein
MCCFIRESWTGKTNYLKHKFTLKKPNMDVMLEFHSVVMKGFKDKLAKLVEKVCFMYKLI